MKQLLHLITLIFISIFIRVGIFIGLLWHSFQAGVLYSESLIEKLIKKHDPSLPIQPKSDLP
jgi:hypothetical protein